jgi:hypothetical protein
VSIDRPRSRLGATQTFALTVHRSVRRSGNGWPIIPLTALFTLLAGCAINETVTIHDGTFTCELHASVSVGDGWARCGRGEPPVLGVPGVPPPVTQPAPADPNAAPSLDPNAPQPAPAAPAAPDPGPLPGGAELPFPTGPYAEIHGANMSVTTAGVLSGLVSALATCAASGCF